MQELTPQQIKFLECYLNIKSDTFGNALQSALKAGYSQEYAESITAKDLKWLSENGGDSKLLLKAIRNLDKFLDDEKEKRIQADITKFVAERLGKKKFGNNMDITSAGEKINSFTDEQETEIAQRILKEKYEHQTNREQADSQAA